MKQLRKVLALIVIMALVLTATGCGGASSSIPTATPDAGTAGTSASTPAPTASSEGVVDKMVDQVSKMLTANGREFDKVITGGLNDTLSNKFFDMTVTAAKTAEELEGAVPQVEGNKFVIATVSVKNVFGETIPVGNYDFYVMWDGGEDASYLSFYDAMYPDDVELAAGETLTGDIVVEVPADATNVMLVYDEVYDDDFKGNSYAVTLGV